MAREREDSTTTARVSTKTLWEQLKVRATEYNWNRISRWHRGLEVILPNLCAGFTEKYCKIYRIEKLPGPRDWVQILQDQIKLARRRLKRGASFNYSTLLGITWSYGWWWFYWCLALCVFPDAEDVSSKASSSRACIWTVAHGMTLPFALQFCILYVVSVYHWHRQNPCILNPTRQWYILRFWWFHKWYSVEFIQTIYAGAHRIVITGSSSSIHFPFHEWITCMYSVPRYLPDI